MNHNDQVTETASVVLNVEFWISHLNDDAAVLSPETAKRVLLGAGVEVHGLPALTSFDGCYHVDVARPWWDDLLASGDDFEGEGVWDGTTYQVHLAMV